MAWVDDRERRRQLAIRHDREIDAILRRDLDLLLKIEALNPRSRRLARYRATQSFSSIELVPATPEEDIYQSTDITATAIFANIGFYHIPISKRVRDKRFTFRDFTLVSQTRTGQQVPEIQRIAGGQCALYIYCWESDDDRIREYIIVDLDRLRDSRLLNEVIENDETYQNKPNPGTGELFKAIPIGKLDESGALLYNTIGSTKDIVSLTDFSLLDPSNDQIEKEQEKIKESVMNVNRMNEIIKKLTRKTRPAGAV